MRRRWMTLTAAVTVAGGAAALLLGGGARSADQTSSHAASTAEMTRKPAAAIRREPAREANAAGKQAPLAADDAGEASPPSAASLVARLADSLEGEHESDAERAERQTIERRLRDLGDDAVAALVARLDRNRDRAGVRDLMFDVLRRLPGAAAEHRLLLEARRGDHEIMRTMAIESLAERRTDRAIAALGEIARTDPNLPPRPLLGSPRDPADTSTELPDETVFTPRMQAMAALASTGDPRAVDVLTAVLRTGPDESLRMEAARNLEAFSTDPRAVEALKIAAVSDPSAYVRLSALHTLGAAAGRSSAVATDLAPIFEGVAARDRDAGVRALAQRLMLNSPLPSL